MIIWKRVRKFHVTGGSHGNNLETLLDRKLDMDICVISIAWELYLLVSVLGNIVFSYFISGLPFKYSEELRRDADVCAERATDVLCN